MTAARQLTDSVYYIPGPTNVGVIAERPPRSGAAADGGADKGAGSASPAGKRGTAVYLVDSGGSAADGERVYAALERLFPEDEGGFQLKAVINTHSHADHSGGNAALRRKTGCGIMATAGEKGSLENPETQPALAWGGRPLPELRTDYYKCEKSDVTDVISAGAHIALAGGARIDFTALPGHYFDMIGVICTESDGRRVIFTGDAVFGRGSILKYWIPFLYDVRAFKRTLDRLCGMRAFRFVPSHGEPVARIEETAELNKIAVLSTETCILNILKRHPATQEEILAEAAAMNGIRLALPQFVLIGCTLRSYLTYLYEEHKIRFTLEDNRMLWHAERTAR